MPIEPVVPIEPAVPVEPVVSVDDRHGVLIMNQGQDPVIEGVTISC